MKICKDGDLIFILILAAIKMDEMGKSKEDFVLFAAEIWESLKLNDISHLKSVITDAIMDHLSSAFE